MKWITPEESTLIEALALVFSESTKSTLRSWLKQGRIAIDGKVVRQGATLLKKGQEICLKNKERLLQGGLKILYEDRHFVAVEKPTGLLSVATHFEQSETVHSILKQYFRPLRVYVVHRLDQDTSGVMLFALSQVALEKLKELFKSHSILREYDAIVEGHLFKTRGTWESYLYEDSNYVVRETLNQLKGEKAVTNFRVLGESIHYSWLRLKLETGKKNQIRVHCQSFGNPVTGDKKYGAKKNPIKRLCLHASLLSFRHPILGKMMRFSSEVPRDFSKIVRLNEKNDV